MKPVKLEFEGINSFSEHTIIDFEKLMQSGIFGIFGDTGSGKSTILDCINFALYGRVERSKEKTDIINYRCNSASVKFTFTMVNGGRRRTYYIERLIKNDKSGTHRAALYEDGVCIADKATETERKVVEILGLEAEDFRKCIALPQGEFSQFVKSAPRDRLALIERLFSLSKYGDRLKEKISAKQSEAESEYGNLSGKYSAYDDVTPEGAELLAKRLKEGEARLKDGASQMKITAERYAAVSALFKKKQELDETVAKISELEKADSELKELRRDFALLPVCREAKAVFGELGDVRKKILETSQKLKLESEKLERAEKAVQEIQKELSEGNFPERSEEYTKLSAKYKTCAGKPEKLDELKRALAAKRNEYSAAEAERGKYLKEYSALEELAESLKPLQGNDIDELRELMNVEFKGAVLKDEYAATLDYFVSLNAMVERYGDGTDLYKFISGELKEKIAVYKRRISDLKDFKLENVTDQLEALSKAAKEREEISRKLIKLTQDKSTAQGLIKVSDNKLETLLKEGAELRKRFDELKTELSEVFGSDCGDYAAEERNNEERLEKVKAQWRGLQEKLERAQRERSETALTFEKLKTLGLTLKESEASLFAKLNSAVAKSGLQSAEKCLETVQKFEAVPDAEKTLNELDMRLAAARARMAELRAVEGISAVRESDVAEALRLKENEEEEFARLNGEVAVMRSGLSTLKERLAEKNSLREQLEGAKKRLDLIGRLKELTKNNRFLEYIADEYLCDISAAASSTLLKLTDGRYFLVYRDNNFYVGDNFDCGNLRGVNTLSGGETFLLSLSLALALSKTICSDSLKSIEFFFLDEGFGTLDSSLIDTVMSALEKLKNEHFTIGVISHVEELKHRIDSKITVLKATESHGSTVQACC